MAVKLRLVRMGKKKQPTYRVVAAESRRFFEPRTVQAQFVERGLNYYQETAGSAKELLHKI